MSVGMVYAENVEDKESKTSIEHGFVGGEGLLGDILYAGLQLAQTTEDYGYFGGSKSERKQYYQAVKDARYSFYVALKKMENKCSQDINNKEKVTENGRMWRKYRVRGAVIREVEAIQFDPKDTCWPNCIISWRNGNYQPRDGSWGYIETGKGKTHIQSSDWIIKDGTGHLFVAEPKDFNKAYELLQEDK